MRSFVVASLTVLTLACAANAGATGWRDLRVDGSGVTQFDDSIQQMRDQLPHNRAVLFVLTLKDLKARFSPAEYRERLNGLTYKEIVRLGSPSVVDDYLAYYGRLHAGHAADPTGAPTFEGFVGSPPNPFGPYPGFDSATGHPLLAQ